MRSRAARALTLLFGVLLLALGVVEVITHLDDTVGALLFWGLSLLGGGTLVLAGLLLWSRRPRTGLGLVVVGTLAGLNATIWTLVMPLIGIAVAALAIRDFVTVADQGPRLRRLGPGDTTDLGGQPPKASA